MNYWNQYPFIRLLLGFISGIFISLNTAIPLIISNLVPLALGILFLVSHRQFYKSNKWKIVPGIVLFMMLASFGICLVQQKTAINNKRHFTYFKEGSTDYILRIKDPLHQKAKTYKTQAEVIAVKKENRWIPTTGIVLLYIAKEEQAAALKYGSVILCHSPIIPTPPPQNPYEFNYKRYLSFHQVDHQVYLSPTSWVNLNYSIANPLFKYAYQVRDRLLDIFKENDIRGDEYGVGAALILGYEDELSQDIVNAYSATGALHVLSVSGLHVGIVFIVINFLLGFLGEKKWARVLRFVLTLYILWAYTILSGLSPSVTRAATMFTFILIGKALKMNASIYNIIAFSAFLLLCINPFMITEVGFQLSYLAVIGIVLFHKGLYQLYVPANKFWQQVWSITCVSVAAQFVTFPLGLLYFHQFPNYFMLSNLVVIPISTAVLYVGILLLAVAKFTWLALWVGKLLSGLLYWLNASVIFFEKLPYALIDGIAISVFETFVLFGFVMFTYCFFELKKPVYLKLMIGCCIALCATQLVEKYEQQRQQKIVFYAIKKHSAIDFIKGTENVFIADTDLLKDYNTLHFHVFPNWDNCGLSKMNGISFDALKKKKQSFVDVKDGYVNFNNTVLLFPQFCNNFQQLSYRPDYIVWSKKMAFKIEALHHLFPKAKILADGTISEAFVEKIKRKIPGADIVSVIQNGSVSLNL